MSNGTTLSAILACIVSWNSFLSVPIENPLISLELPLLTSICSKPLFL